MRNSERGFTLVEIAVVLGIIAVMSTIAAPNLLVMRDNFRNKGAASDVAAMMRSGRSRAMELNVPHALVVRVGSVANSVDDRAVLLECPPGTSGAYNFGQITQAMIDGSVSYPAGFSVVRVAELGTTKVGIGPGSQGVLTVSAAYAKVPRTTGCSFCDGSGVGAIVFKSDGSLVFTGAGEYGSVTVSVTTRWPTPSESEMYTISLSAMTGEVRVWH